MFQVGDRKGGARIAVTRLSDRTGIEEIAARRFNAQRGNGFAGARANPEDLELVVLIGKAALVVRVSKKSDWSGGVQEAVEGLRRSKDVFVLILKRAWTSTTPSVARGPWGKADNHARCSGWSCARVHSTADFATTLKSSVAIRPVTALS